jgi:hypothetical protein
VVDVFEQVEEELRSDRYKRLARTWLPVVGGVLAVALIAALGWWGWQSWQTSQADKASAAYQQGMEALEQENVAAARTAFETAAKEGNGAYKALALMQQAGLALGQNQTQQAIELFDQAARASRDPLIADAARLKAAFLVMDTAPLDEITDRLQPLTDEDRPFSAFAQEALALARLQHGQTKEARDALVQLQLGQGVPDDLRQRAQAAIQSIDNGTAANLAPLVRAQAAIPAPTPGQARPAQAQPAPAQPAQAAPAAAETN